MTPAAGFLAGLGCGFTLLVASALRPVSPRWLRVLLLCLMLVQAAWYLLSLLASPAVWLPWSEPLWLLTATGLLVSSVFAIDQLLRHPAMSPRRLLRWCSPLLIVAIVAAPLLRYPPLIPFLGRALLYLGVYMLGSLGFSIWMLVLFPKIPSRVMRGAVCLLAAAHAMRAGEILYGLWRVGIPAIVHADLFLLMSLWYAYDLAYRLDTNR